MKVNFLPRLTLPLDRLFLNRTAVESIKVVDSGFSPLVLLESSSMTLVVWLLVLDLVVVDDVLLLDTG